MNEKICAVKWMYSVRWYSVSTLRHSMSSVYTLITFLSGEPLMAIQLLLSPSIMIIIVFATQFNSKLVEVLIVQYKQYRVNLNSYAGHAKI